MKTICHLILLISFCWGFGCSKSDSSGKKPAFFRYEFVYFYDGRFLFKNCFVEMKQTFLKPPNRYQLEILDRSSIMKRYNLPDTIQVFYTDSTLNYFDQRFEKEKTLFFFDRKDSIGNFPNIQAQANFFINTDNLLVAEKTYRVGWSKYKVLKYRCLEGVIEDFDTKKLVEFVRYKFYLENFGVLFDRRIDLGYSLYLKDFEGGDLPREDVFGVRNQLFADTAFFENPPYSLMENNLKRLPRPVHLDSIPFQH